MAQSASLTGREAIFSDPEPHAPASGQVAWATWIISRSEGLGASLLTAGTNLFESAAHHREPFKLHSNIPVKLKI